MEMLIGVRPPKEGEDPVAESFCIGNLFNLVPRPCAHRKCDVIVGLVIRMSWTILEVTQFAESYCHLLCMGSYE